MIHTLVMTFITFWIVVGILAIWFKISDWVNSAPPPIKREPDKNGWAYKQGLKAGRWLSENE